MKRYFPFMALEYLAMTAALALIANQVGGQIATGILHQLDAVTVLMR